MFLLALVVLAGLLSLTFLHYRISEQNLRAHQALIDLLAQTDLIARAVHELQRERGLTSSYLTSRDLRFLQGLQDQYTETNQRLEELGAALPARAIPIAAHEAYRRKVAALGVSSAESFGYYTERIGALLDVSEHFSVTLAVPHFGQELAAQVDLLQATEFLGQTRATLMAANPNGPAEPGWLANLGERSGLFEWHYGRFRQFSSAPPGDVPELAEARRILAAAMKGEFAEPTVAQRLEWYRILTAAIDHLHVLERNSLAVLAGQASARMADMRFKVGIERAGLLAVIALLFFLAFSSLRLLLNALEASLRAARRARFDPASFTQPATNTSDEAREISSGVGDLLSLVDRLTRQASTDHLTGALNRQGFSEIAEGELERARRYRRRLAMIMFDLDHFKVINDQFGHTSGDAVLQAMAGLVHEHLRLADVFARWGGEEFIVLAPETSEEEAVQLAEKLRCLFREFRAPGVPTFTASFGVTAFLPEDRLEHFFERADRALYAAKTGGRDRVIAFDAQAEALRAAEKPGRRRLAVVRDHPPKRRGKT